MTTTIPVFLSTTAGTQEQEHRTQEQRTQEQRTQDQGQELGATLLTLARDGNTVMFPCAQTVRSGLGLTTEAWPKLQYLVGHVRCGQKPLHKTTTIPAFLSTTAGTQMGNLVFGAILPALARAGSYVMYRSVQTGPRGPPGRPAWTGPQAGPATGPGRACRGGGAGRGPVRVIHLKWSPAWGQERRRRHAP